MHKVFRAKVHLDALSDGVEQWKKSQANTIFGYDDPKGTEYVIEIRPVATGDIELALIAGDFVCCLRSSLDQLAWQMASQSGRQSNRICFPIFGQDSLETQVSIVKATFGIPEGAINLMRQLQPYNNGDTFKAHYLWILHTLWNVDKHRHITMYSTQADYGFVAGTPTPIRSEQFDDHAKLIFSIADKANVKFEPSVNAEIFFGDHSEGIKVTIAQLREIYEAVRNQIIPAFAGFFKEANKVRNK